MDYSMFHHNLEIIKNFFLKNPYFVMLCTGHIPTAETDDEINELIANFDMQTFFVDYSPVKELIDALINYIKDIYKYPIDEEEIINACLLELNNVLKYSKLINFYKFPRHLL